jgi:hypothetical protein
MDHIKYFLCGLRGLGGSKYKKPINAIYQHFVNWHRDFRPKPVKPGVFGDDKTNDRSTHAGHLFQMDMLKLECAEVERLMILKSISGVALLALILNASWAQAEEPGTYIGWKQCAACHSPIDTTWQKTRHANAIESLKKTSQQNLPDCVKCHVTGYEKDGGFIDYELTPEMAGVQCEVCHGPGSKHAENPVESRDSTIKRK